VASLRIFGRTVTTKALGGTRTDRHESPSRPSDQGARTALSGAVATRPIGQRERLSALASARPASRRRALSMVLSRRVVPAVAAVAAGNASAPRSGSAETAPKASRPPEDKTSEGGIRPPRGSWTDDESSPRAGRPARRRRIRLATGRAPETKRGPGESFMLAISTIVLLILRT
jgi:hypothetical protein